jgi:hypothetical protein
MRNIRPYKNTATEISRKRLEQQKKLAHQGKSTAQEQTKAARFSRCKPEFDRDPLLPVIQSS